MKEFEPEKPLIVRSLPGEPGGILEEEPIIIVRGKITYYVFPERVLVNVGGGQWVSYNPYDNWNRQGITLFRQTILKSKENEYDNASDQMSLAVQCSIRGVRIRAPQL